MEVKIYREPENVGLLLDDEPEVKPDKTPSVYQVLNTSQTRALEALCPATTELKKYSRSTIPVEVLQAIKFVVDNDMFDVIQVWFDDKNPDPMIIGRKYNNDNDRQKGYSWTMTSTLIARWGDCAYELNELVEMGKKRLVEEKKEKAIDLLQKINSFLEYPEIHINKYLSDGYVNFER